MRWRQPTALAVPLALGVLLCAPGAACQSKATTQPQSGFAPVPAGQLYYEAAGSGSALVLVHGAQLDRRMWDDQFGKFAAHYRVIRYDVRRFGRSSRPSAPYSDEDDLQALLDHLRLGRVCILGLSMGGRVALDFALAHPERVECLLLAGASLGGFQGAPDPNIEGVLAAAQAGDAERATDLWMQDRIFAVTREQPELLARIRRLSRENAAVWLDDTSLRRELSPPALGRLAEIHLPVLIVLGQRDIENIQQIAGLLRARIAGAHTEVIPGAGHLMNMERPNEFNRVVLEFLASIHKQP
ncbi:MAG TPA: alpha/beta fold hydrolase [Candidatus Sulfotelmatobacter sp.]|nr:alpha/beta fold hydrolase [Candidatus Sulfotelmatobacter sp.]